MHLNITKHSSTQAVGRLESCSSLERHCLLSLSDVCGRVQGGGPDNVQLALDLVSFDRRVQPAMAWVFGATLVCRDLDTAKRVTFHPRVRRRCVTLDGDVFEPSGTLSGGARQQVTNTLIKPALYTHQLCHMQCLLILQ